MTSTSFPPHDHALALHNRLLAGDPLAPSDLATALFEPLVAWVRSRNPRVDETLCCDAAVEAFLSYLKKPEAFRPERASLESYLKMAAGGDLKNALAKEQRRRAHLASFEAVELSADMRKYLQECDSDPARVAELAEDVAKWLAERNVLPNDVREGLSPRETQVLALMRIGERRTEMYVSILDLHHLTPAEQRREVKRVKDRLKKRLQQAGAPR